MRCPGGNEQRLGRRSLTRAVAASIIVVSFLTIVPPCLAVELFGPRLGLRTGDGPSHAVSADFDGNGVPDIATATFGDDTVTVVLADGQGGFDVLPPVHVRPYAVSIAAGDFNADGAADLAVLHFLGNSLSILLGDGEGGFSFEGELETGQVPSFVAAGDFDFDGAADLVVANSADDTVTVLSSDGGGGFSTTAEFPVGTFPRSVTVADLDGDAILDLAVANMWSDSISILLGDGFGGFEAVEEVLVGVDRGPTAVAVDDFDLDGNADLAVANGGDDSVTIHLGDGTGLFVFGQDIPGVGDSPVWLTVEDFDGDGDPDLAVTNFLSNTLTILRGDPAALVAGSDGFVETLRVELQENPRSAVAGDFTGDGAVDLGVVVAGSDLVTVLPGDGLGGFSAVEQISDVPLDYPYPWGANEGLACLRAADFNRDGRADLAVSSRRENALFVYLGGGQGNFDPANATRVDVVSPFCMAVDDLDGDGKLDIAVATGLPQDTPGAVSLFLGDGEGEFSPSHVLPVGSYPVWVVSGDLDLDGDVDLATTNSSSDSMSILLGDGIGGFADQDEIPTGAAPTSAAVADIDNDSVLDLAVANRESDSVSIHRGAGNGDFTGLVGGGPRLTIDSPEEIAGEYPWASAVFGPPPGATEISGLVELADDGDGTTTDACEPLLDNYDGGIVLVDRGSCNFTAKVKHAQEAGAAAVIVATDHRPTTTMYGTDPTITIPSVMISREHGDLIKSALPDVYATLFDPDAERLIAVGSEPCSVVAGNFDGDGRTDLAVGNSGGSTVSILSGDGQGGFAETLQVPVGENPDSLVVADLNLDGLDDLAFVLRNDDSVGVLINDGEGGFVPTPLFHSGSEPRSLAVSDFDGDGTPDVAASNLQGNSISTLFSQIEDRVDPNGSNRIDAFDVAGVGRTWHLRSGEPGYKRNWDIDLNGVINGDDLSLVASRFGSLVKEASPFRATLENPLASEPNTITLQPRDTEAGHRLTVDVMVNDDNDPTCSAEFAVTFSSLAGDGDTTQLLEAVGFETGDYLSGGLTQAYEVETGKPGLAEVRVTRLPGENRVGSGQQRLLSLILEAKKAGTAMLDFAPIEGRAMPSLLDAAGHPVPGVSFVGGVTATIETTQEAATGQKIGFSPALVDFGAVPVGASSQERLRLANFGFADLEVFDVTSTLPEFVSFFTSRFTIPPYGSVALPVRFSPTTPGVYAGELIVSSDDPEHPVVRAPILARSELSVTVTPSFVDFGSVTIGSSATRRIGIGNRGNAPLVLTSVTVTDALFAVRTEFTVLNPGEFGAIEVEFQPSSAGNLHGLLTLGFDAPEAKTVALSLAGTGRAGP